MYLFKRFSPYLLILGSVGDFSLPYVFGSLIPSYSQSSMLISQLGETTTPFHTTFNHLSIVTGTLFVLGGIGTWMNLSDQDSFSARFLGSAIIFYGIGDCILSGLVQIDDSQSFFSFPYFFHALFSGLAMLALLAIPLYKSWRAYLVNQKKQALFWFMDFFFAGLSLGLFAAYYQPFFSSFFLSTRGLWQRVSLILLYFPLLLLAVQQVKRKRA